MLYKLRAYKSRTAGESGRVTPDETSSSGSWATAKHYAKQYADYHGACIVENTETGERVWFVKGTP